MDDIEKIKTFVKSTDKKVLKEMLTSNPCVGCAKNKNCKYKKKGMLCGEAAKNIIDSELEKIESEKERMGGR